MMTLPDATSLSRQFSNQNLNKTLSVVPLYSSYPSALAYACNNICPFALFSLIFATTFCPRGEFKRTNIVAGICQGKWIAPLEYTGTTDSVLFVFWFEHCLLKELSGGVTIILDNATFHKKAALASLAEQHHCHLLFLPPYSPDLNPIEKKWAWLKRKLRELLTDFDSFDNALHALFQVS